MTEPQPAECTNCHGYDSPTCPNCLGTGQQPEFTDAQLTAELAPLATIIRTTLATTPVTLGREPEELTAALTLAIAAYMGRIVPAEHELAELARLRGAVDAARVVARHGEMTDQARTELNDALNTES